MDSTQDGQGGNGKQVSDISCIYGPLVQLAIHGQENKWWMLYVFLMFNSIILLSCAALYAAQQYGVGHKILLYLFPLAGILVDVCWIVMTKDYVKASNLYSKKAVEAESLLPPHFPKPLKERDGQRAVKSRFGTSEFIATAIPVLLIVMYVVIVLLARQRPAS